MKHIEYHGYPENFYHLCREGGKFVCLHPSLSKRMKGDMLDDFFKEMEEHGYDVFKPADGIKFDRAVEILNECIKLDSVRWELKSYKKLIVDDEICTCGRWVFLKYSPILYEGEEIEIKQGRGGRREGSGRKSSISALKYDNRTTTIRVPEIFKDTFKKMSALFIEQASNGVDVRSVLFNVTWQLKNKAKEYREGEYKSDITESWAKECDQACELIGKLYDLIPSIYVKEECIKNGNVTESNKNEL